MSGSKLPRRISRVVWTLFALSLPVLLHATPVKFISSGDQAYVEVKGDGGVQKIYTESHGDYKALLVLGEKNNPELLEFSYADGKGTIATVVMELRSQKGVPSPGLAVDNKFIGSLSSDADGFREWQARFSSFPAKPTDYFVITEAAFADPLGIDILDEKGGFALRIKNLLCSCLGGFCFSNAWMCMTPSLCRNWNCIENGNWGPECEGAMQDARACMVLYQ